LRFQIGKSRLFFVTQDLFDQKIHVANFIFTSCGSICPTMTHNMKIVSDSLGNDQSVVFLSYSVTPWIDSPDVLSIFITNNSITNPNWHFLTGNKTEIYNLVVIQKVCLRGIVVVSLLG